MFDDLTELSAELSLGDIFNQAKNKAQSLGKPLLNAGCGATFIRGIEESDYNLDIINRNVPNFILGDVEDLPIFFDKQFGAVFCANVLEHVKDVQKAKTELTRISDYQFYYTPSPLQFLSWVHPNHRRVFTSTDGNKVLLELPPKPFRSQDESNGVLPMPPKQGPPLPCFLGVYWPFYNGTKLGQQIIKTKVS